MNGFLVRDTRTKDFFPFRLGKSKKRTGLYWIHPVACKQTTNPVAFLSLFLILEDAGCEFFQENLSLSPSSPSNNLFCCSQKRMRVVGGRKLNRCTAYYSTHTVDGMVNTLPSRSIEKCGRIVGEREGWICTAAHWSIGCVGKSGRRQRGLSLSQAAGHSPPCL